MKRPLWIGLIVLGLGLAYWGLSRAFIPASAGARVVRGKAISAVTGSVSVLSAAQTTIVSPEYGTLAEIHVTDGQAVHAGDVIARLDPRDLPFLKQEAVTNLADIERRLKDPLPSEIRLESMQKDLAVDAEMLKINQIGPATYDNNQRAVLEQQTIARQDRSALETQRDVLKNSLAKYDDEFRRLQIAAPYDGAITSVLAHAGDVLRQGAPVASMISKELKIQSEVNQDDIASVSEGEPAQVRFFAYSYTQFPARVKLILPSSDPATQRFTVLLELLQVPPNLMAGLTGEVSFIAGEHDHTLLIPRRALIGDKDVAVYENGRARIREVEPGFKTLTKAEILSGLKEGDIVLTENLDLLRDGDRVSLTTVDEGKGGKQP